MKTPLSYFVLLFVLVIPFGCQNKVATPKHIFFIVIDTLRADHLNSYGYKVPTSSTIDRIAKEGILFTNAYSTASSTLESVISFFNSNTALTNKIYELSTQEAKPLSNSSLQNYLKQDGYNTLTVISSPWLVCYQDYFKAGFDHFQYVSGIKWWSENTTDEMTQAVLTFLDTKFKLSGKNFFYIHYLDPHDPYRPPVDYKFFSGKPPDRILAADFLSSQRELIERYHKDSTYAGLPTPKPVTKNELNYLISKYDSEIKHVDLSLEKLLNKLSEMGILQESLIIITADHGEEFLEHGCLKHGFQLYDETIHIPLIFYWPERFAPMVKQDLVSGIDIAPTILELCKIKPPDSMLGKNILSGTMLDFLRKIWKQDSIVFCTHFTNQKQQGMKMNNWKLIENLKTGQIKIFDTNNDPKEQNNLFDNNAPRWNDLFTEYKKLLIKHGSKEYERKGNQEKFDIDPEIKNQLKALGYL